MTPATPEAVEAAITAYLSAAVDAEPGRFVTMARARVLWAQAKGE